MMVGQRYPVSRRADRISIVDGFRWCMMVSSVRSPILTPAGFLKLVHK